MEKNVGEPSGSMRKCKRCRNNVQDGLQCIRCGIISHKSCLKALKNVKFLDDNTVICCSENSAIEKCTQDNNIAVPLSDEHPDKIRIHYLEQIIKEKELLIQQQNLTITALQENIELLKQVNDSKKPLSVGKPNQSTSEKVLVTDNNENNNYINKNKKATSKVGIDKGNTPGNARYISAAEVSNAIRNAQVETTSKAKTAEAVTTRERQSTRIILTGSQKINGNCPLRAVETIKFKYFHLTKMAPDTNEEELLKYLESFASHVKLEKLESRYPQYYTSFKISVKESEAQKILDPEIWPEGAILNRFFQQRKNITSSR